MAQPNRFNMTDPLDDWQPGRSRRRREAASISYLVRRKVAFEKDLIRLANLPLLGPVGFRLKHERPNFLGHRRLN